MQAARDQAVSRRDAAVTALEAVRLDLLRVHADVAPSALTDLVARARRLSGIGAGLSSGLETPESRKEEGSKLI
jgi:hypothetical protein